MLKIVFSVMLAIALIAGTYWIVVTINNPNPIRFHIVFEEPTTKEENEAKKMVEDAQVGETLLQYLEKNTPVCQNTIIRYGTEQGPIYIPSIKEIWIPYAFITDTKELLKKHKYAPDETSLNEYTIDVIEFVLIHEIGHALVHQLQIPVAGKEEDAVDTLAAILLIDNYPEGDDIVLSSADYWALMNAERPEHQEDDYADEHSLDKQRFYGILCLIIGSNPEKYAETAKKLGLDENRMQYCIVEFHKKKASWTQLLQSGTPEACDLPIIYDEMK